MTLQEIHNNLTRTKYSTLYIKIISNATQENRIKSKKDNSDYIYYEAHHILPNAVHKNYSDFRINPWNKVLLTAREHFICHILLMKHYRKINNKNSYMKMSRAIKFLSDSGKYNSKLYESYKLNLSHSQETKDKISISRKGSITSQETKDKISISNTGNKHLQETKDKIGKANKISQLGSKDTQETKNKKILKLTGRSVSLETKLKISNSNKGQIRTQETKNNISKSMTGKKLSQEHRANIKKSNKSKEQCLNIEIYDNFNNLMYSTNSTFIPFCKLNNLPSKAFINSYRNGTKLYQTKRSLVLASKNGNDKFKGWYAIKLSA